MTLIVNPLAAIRVLDGGAGLISGGPVPGRGKFPLEISVAERPRLHALFTELAEIGLNHLDIANDLDDDETKLLVGHGILIESDNVPEQPLFACMLDDVEENSDPHAQLIVNPTLEFQPFDLAKFRSWVHGKHLSPHHATAWVTDTRTQIPSGYWLNPEQADLISSLEPGSRFSAEAAPDVVSKLYAAGILIDPENNDIPADIRHAAESFSRDRYVVIDDIVPPAQVNALRDYYRRYVEQGFMQFGDPQVPLRFVEHNEPVARMFLVGLAPLMSRIAGVEVTPTYTYSAVYIEGAKLEPHVDRAECEFSFSMQLDYLPEPETEVSPWALYVSSAGDVSLIDPETDSGVYLHSGSCLAYKGRELIHYRTPLPQGHRSTSIFFHYVPLEDGS